MSTRWIALPLALAALSPSAQGQVIRPNRGDAGPVLTMIRPPGATAGADVEWTVSGRNLDACDLAFVSGEGVSVREVVTGPGGTRIVRARVDPSAAVGYWEVMLDGPDGLSNPLTVRIDHLRQVEEVEPNDEPSEGQAVEVGSAVAGVLGAQDVDHVRVVGRAGQRVTFEVEARRLGTAIAPVLTVLGPTGVALAQARRDPGGDGDCRLAFTFPADGTYAVQVRDNTYAGGDSAAYRLRLDPAPHGTGVFPLGGPAGGEVVVEVSGGSLDAPLTRAVALPAAPGVRVEVPAVDTTAGPILPPGRLAVGDGPEVREGPGVTPLPLGAVANGRLDRPGEVDRYRIEAVKGQAIRLRVEASELGSWLDSVLVLRDAAGAVLAENDDPGNNRAPRGGAFFGIAPAGVDSQINYTPSADGPLTVEVVDRYGGGGPEYGYRLAATAGGPDFDLKLLIGTAGNNRQVRGRVATPTGPGALGVFNLRPGSTTPVNFLLTPLAATSRGTGRPDPIRVRAEGLPPGVTSEPVTVRPGDGTQPVGGALILKVAPGAEAALGTMRVVAETGEGDAKVSRTASSALTLPANVPGQSVRPVTRTLHAFPVKVVGPRRRPAGPPEPIALREVRVPGVLLVGDRLALDLVFDPPIRDARDLELRASSEAPGVSTAAVLSTQDGAPTEARVRVSAGPSARPGVADVSILASPRGGETLERVASVLIRPPVAVRAGGAPIRIGPGGSAEIPVFVRREPGFAGAVRLEVVDPPEGLVADPATIGPDATSGSIRLRRTDGPAWSGPSALRVRAVARMPLGRVSAESPVRPMVEAADAEE